MELSKLLSVLGEKQWDGHERQISGIKYDSRQVVPGDLFVAVRGREADGHKFIPHALANGAAAVVSEHPVAGGPIGAAMVIVPDSRKALPVLAAQFHGHPTKKLTLIGITGTNGKTTTSHLVRRVLMEAGNRTGLCGTISHIVCDQERASRLTTPESTELQQAFREMVECGTTYAVIEASSHALDLGRVDTCEFDVGVFTNLTQDHLDYHGTMENYRDAKAKLFQMLGKTYLGEPKKGPKAAVINLDDPTGLFMAGKCDVPVITYGIGEGRDVQALDIRYSAGGVSFKVSTPLAESRLDLKLAGRINVYNSLAAIATGVAFGVGLETQKAALERVKGMPGRFERVDRGQKFSVIVDYAHSPDGLANVLRAARDITAGKVIVVFGCGGDRDRKKRPIMGRIAIELADYAIVTSDNPRSEDPEAIIDEIEEGMRRLGSEHKYKRQADRETAIREAIMAASEGDVVLLAGKGHETYQIFRDSTLHFDDREVALRLLEERRKSSPDMFV